MPRSAPAGQRTARAGGELAELRRGRLAVGLRLLVCSGGRLAVYGFAFSVCASLRPLGRCGIDAGHLGRVLLEEICSCLVNLGSLTVDGRGVCV